MNVFQRGTLISSQFDASDANNISFTNPIMYGTADGGLGLIVQLSDSTFSFLDDLQKRIAAVLRNCLRIEHDTYRNFVSDKRVEQWTGFIDGDLVEMLTDIPRNSVEGIVDGLRIPKELSGSAQGRLLNPNAAIQYTYFRSTRHSR